MGRFRSFISASYENENVGLICAKKKKFKKKETWYKFPGVILLNLTIIPY